MQETCRGDSARESSSFGNFTTGILLFCVCCADVSPDSDTTGKFLCLQ
jgi:hypothetical protein